MFVDVRLGKLAELVDVTPVHDEQLDDDVIPLVGSDPKRRNTTFRRQVRVASWSYYLIIIVIIIVVIIIIVVVKIDVVIIIVVVVFLI